MSNEPWSPHGPPGGGDLKTLLGRPIRKSSDAIRMMRTARIVWEIEEDNAILVVGKIDDWLRPLATTDNCHRYLRGHGLNLTVADVLCARTRSEFSVLREYIRNYGGLTSGLMNLYDRANTALEASSEYLDVIAGVLHPSQSRNMQAVQSASDKVAITVAVAGAIVLLPATLAFLGEIGAGAAVAHLVRAGATHALYFVGTNPVAGLAILDFTVGTVVAVGMAGGPEKFAQGLTTADGALSQGADIIILILTIRSGAGPVPRRSGGGSARRAAESGSQIVQVTGTKVSESKGRINMRIESVEVIDEIPEAVPQPARRESNLVRARGALSQRVRQECQRIKNHPRVNRPDGWSCDDAEEMISTFLKKQGERTTPLGEHVAYIYPAHKEGGPPHKVFKTEAEWRSYRKTQRVYDITAVQFTSKSDKPLDPLNKKGRRPWADFVAAGLDEAIDSGIFTMDQYDEFVKLVQSW